MIIESMLLEQAIIAAGKELANEYNWCFDGEPGEPPSIDNPFVAVVYKHVAPLTDSRTWAEAEVISLRAKLAYLEKILK